MNTENQEVKSNDIKKNNPYPASFRPGIGEPQPSALGSMDMATLRRVYGNSYGTSGYGVINSVPQPGGSNSLVLETWFNNTKLPDLKPQDVITEGIELVKKQYADFNSITHVFDIKAEMSIHLGKILNSLKSVARKTGETWDSWAAKQLPFIKPRTREKFMNLAKRRDCHKYTVLGSERLIFYALQQRDFQDGLIQSELLAKHNIVLTRRKSLFWRSSRSKSMLAIDCERVVKGFTIPRDKISTLRVGAQG